MPDPQKPIRLFIAYSDQDDAIYKELETYLEPLKSKGQIDSWHGRRLTGLEWDQVIDPQLQKSDIILLLTSPDFLAHEYCYGEEVNNAVKLHTKGRVHLIPILVRTTIGLEHTPFENLKTLPSNDKPIESMEWKKREDSFADILRGISKCIKIRSLSTGDRRLSKANPALPFCIKRFHIKNFLCIRDTGLDKIPVDCQWVFITGENGDGKTALLQALAVGLLGDRGADNLLEPDTHIQIEFKKDNENTIHEIFKDSEGWRNYSTDIRKTPILNVMGYGVTRLNIMTRDAEELYKEKSPVISLYKETDGNFRNIETWLKDKYLESKLEETPLITSVKESLRRLMPNIKKIELEGSAIFYHEKGHKARYWQISSGGKMIVAMVGDMIKRFYTAQPQIKDVSEFKGIVLIDELDQHLHPKWQKELPKLLSDVFPNVQFWATTNSIVPFMGAPENSVFLKVTREEDVLTKVERLDIDVKRLLPDTLISSPLFGLEDFIRKGVNDFRTEYLYSEYEKNKDMEERLEKAARKFKLPKSSFFDDDTGVRNEAHEL